MHLKPSGVQINLRQKNLQKHINLTVTVLEDIHSKDSLIIRYFISKVLTDLRSDINVLAFEAGYVGNSILQCEIIAGIKLLQIQIIISSHW